MSFLCTVKGCEYEFENDQALKNHLRDPKAFHGPIPIKQSIPPTVEGEALERKKRLEAYRKNPPEPLASPIVSPEQIKTRTAQPIILQYKYLGECPTCFTEVHTIEVELEKTNAVTAYCISCKKKLAQKLVIPISKQI